MKRGIGFRLLGRLSRCFAFLSFAAALALVLYVAARGAPYLSADLFAYHYNSDNVSMTHAILNTVITLFWASLITVPIGVLGGVYLAEYAKKNSAAVKLVRLTSQTLMGLPSIIFGLFGMLFFVKTLGMGFSVLSGAATLALMNIPVVLRQTETALRAVPMAVREGSLALGAGKVRTVFQAVLPQAMPGVMAGLLLTLGRMIGETAALIYTQGTQAKAAFNPLVSGRTLSMHVFQLQQEGLYVDRAFASAAVLIVLVLCMNDLSRRAGKAWGAGMEE